MLSKMRKKERYKIEEIGSVLKWNVKREKERKKNIWC